MVNSFMRGPSACVNDTDTESDARLRKIPLFPMGPPGDTVLSQAENLLEQNSAVPQRLSPHGGAHATVVNPFPDGPLIQNRDPHQCGEAGHRRQRWGSSQWLGRGPGQAMGCDTILETVRPTP